jgi:hypothetical protein
MPKKSHSEEQMRALRQAEAGAKVSEICREFGISDALFISGGRSTLDWGSASCGNCGSCGRRTASLNGWWRISRWTGTSCKRSCKKSSKASPEARAGALDRGGLRSESTPGGGADENHAQDLGLQQAATPAGRIAAAAARAGGEPGYALAIEG